MAVHSSWNEGCNFIQIDDNVQPATNGCRSSSNCFILDSRAFLWECKLVQRRPEESWIEERRGDYGGIVGEICKESQSRLKNTFEGCSVHIHREL